MNLSSVGRRTEDIAAAYLESKGYRVISRNFRTRFGEIDLIANHEDTLVLVEVKYRRNEDFAPAEEALTAAKQKKLWRAGRVAAARLGPGKNIRFDYLALVGSADTPEIRHYENVLLGDI